MQDTTTATFQGQTVTIKELTVKQVREVFERLNKEGAQFMDDLINQSVPALIVTECTGVPIEQLEEAKPSELVTLCAEVAQVNPSLASMILRRIEASDRLAHLLSSADNLTGLSAQ